MEGSLFLLLHRQTPSTGLLKDLGKQEVYDKRVKGRKLSASDRTKVFVGTVLEAITRSPRKVVQRLAQKIEALTSNAWKCYTDYLLFLYKMQLS
jgi:hypothetical protein